MKKFTITVADEQLKFEEKSYAAIFRSFFNHFIEKDLEKTINVINLVEIRTSEDEFFIAKNGSKKKNFPIGDTDNFIYTHLTPAAMEKAYEKFALGWEGKYVKPEKRVKIETIEDPKEQPEESQELEIQNAENEGLAIPQEKEPEQQELPLPEPAKSQEEIEKDKMAQEEYGVDFSDLVPTQKGKITKKYNQLQKQS